MKPFANLLAVQHFDTARVQLIAQRLRESNAFREIKVPHPNWVVGVAPLPDTAPDPHLLRTLGFFFAEGRDVVGKVIEALAPSGRLLSLAEVSALPGDFAFLQIDREGNGIAVNACMGVVPVYYAKRAGHSILATHIDWILRLLPEEPALDVISNACWLSGLASLTVGRSLVKNVACLEAGTLLTLPRLGAPNTSHYWIRPNVDPVSSTQAEAQKRDYAGELRGHLIHSLQTNLDEHGRNLLSLSGGVDSAVIASLARRCTTHSFRTQTRLLSDPKATQLDLSYVTPLERELGLNSTYLPPLDSASRFQMMRAHSPAFLSHVRQDGFYRLEREVQQHDTRVLFNGHFADMMFDSRGQQTQDWLRLSPFRAIFCDARVPAPRVELAQNWIRWHGLTRQGLRPRRRIPRFSHLLSSAVMEALRSWYRKKWQTPAVWGLEANLGFRADLHRRLRESVVLPSYWEAASPHGARYAFPFLNRHVVELAYRIHPAHQLPGPKELLTIGCRGTVPEANLRRPDKAFAEGPSDEQLEWGTEELPSALKALLSPSIFPQPPTILPKGIAWQLGLLSGIVRHLCTTHPILPRSTR